MTRLETTDIERAFARYDAASPANVVASAWLDGVSESHLEEAFGLVAASHPYLSLRLSEDGASWTESAERPPFTVTDEPALDGELSRPFVGAPVRAVLVRGAPAQLLVTTNHVVADGMSTIQLLRQVLETAGELHHGRRPTLPTRPLRRPSSDVLPVSGTPRMTASEPGPQGFELKAEPPLVSAPPPAERARASRVELWTLDEGQSAALARNATLLGVTVNTLLTAALVFTLRDRVGEGWFQISSSLDLRRRLANTVDPDDLGMWAGRAVLWTQLRRATSFTAFAKTFATMLRDYAEHYPFHGVRAFLVPPVSAPALPHAKITNMGNFDRHGFRADYGFRVEKAVCLTPLHRGWQGDRGLGLIPSSFRGRTNLALIFGDPAWDEAGIRQAIGGFTSWLLREPPTLD